MFQELQMLNPKMKFIPLAVQACVLCLCVSLLAACGGNQTVLPTVAQVEQPTAAAPTTEATAAPTVAAPTAQAGVATDQVLLPAPGTLVGAATEDPNASQLFDSLLFVRTGGIAGQMLTIQLLGNGTLSRDGVVSQVAADQVMAIVAALDKLNFFGLDGVFTASGSSADTYHYQLTVERLGDSRTLNAQDGFIPPEMGQLFARISALGGG